MNKCIYCTFIYEIIDDNDPQAKTTEMVRPRDKEGRKGRIPQEDGEYAGKWNKGRPKKRSIDNMTEDMKEYKMTKEMAEN